MVLIISIGALAGY